MTKSFFVFNVVSKLSFNYTPNVNVTIVSCNTLGSLIVAGRDTS